MPVSVTIGVDMIRRFIDAVMVRITTARWMSRKLRGDQRNTHQNGLDNPSHKFAAIRQRTSEEDARQSPLAILKVYLIHSRKRTRK